MKPEERLSPEEIESLVRAARQEAVDPPPDPPRTVQEVQLQSAPEPAPPGPPRPIRMLMDVPLEITAELGRARLEIREVLALGPGSVVELDKLAGEPIDLLVNGHPVARGEVVVVDETFGVRIVDILSPGDRLSPLG